MKKKLLLLLAGITGLSVVGLAGVASAHNHIRSGDNANIGSNETINSSAYLAGRHIDVAGTVNGDLYCAGQNININGIVHGDVLCAGQNITVSGTVDGDVRVAGQTVVVNASVGHNLTVVAQDFTLNSQGKITGDVTGGTNTMVINGEVGRDMLLGASEATINGTVGRNIQSQVEKLSLGRNAKVGGYIEYTSNNQLNKAPGATVTGSITKHEPKKHENKNGWFGVGFRIYWFLAMLLVALTLVLLFPSVLQASANRTMKSLGITLLFGVAATLFTPVLFVLLAITIVGIPLALILAMAWGLALILSGPFFAYLIGREIWRSQRNHIYTMLVGSVILLLLYNIPFVGFIVMLAALFMGMGMLVREATQRSPKPVYKTK